MKHTGLPQQAASDQMYWQQGQDSERGGLDQQPYYGKNSTSFSA